MSRSRPTFDDLLGDLYASVSDVERFDCFASHLRTAMNAHLIAIQTDDSRHRHQVVQHYADEPIEVPSLDYANDASINLYFARAVGLDFYKEGVINGSSLFAPGELQRTAFYAETLTPIDVHWSLGLCLSSTASGEHVAMSVSRDRRRPDFGPDAMELAHRLLPHVRNVYAIQQHLATANAMLSGVECLDIGIWLIDRAGLIAHANAAAIRMTESGAAGLGCKCRQLRARWAPDRFALHRALECAVAGPTRHHSELMLHDPQGSPWAACEVHPLREGAFPGVSSTATAAVFVHPLVHAAPSAAVLRHLFRLTPAEAQLACALLEKGSLAGCIGSMSQRRETLRTHLKGLFAKTDTHRQADLLRRLETGLH